MHTTMASQVGQPPKNKNLGHSRGQCARYYNLCKGKVESDPTNAALIKSLERLKQALVLSKNACARAELGPVKTAIASSKQRIKELDIESKREAKAETADDEESIKPPFKEMWRRHCNNERQNT